MRFIAEKAEKLGLTQRVYVCDDEDTEYLPFLGRRFVYKYGRYVGWYKP